MKSIKKCNLKWLLSFVVFVLFSCKKEQSISGSNPHPDVDVYVAGTAADTTTSRTNATYWKNGVPQTLMHGEFPNGALSIAVSGNDVYVTGYQIGWSPTGHPVSSIFWKNGAPVTVNLGIDSVSVGLGSVAVSGTAVYVSGSEIDAISGKFFATYWKNDNPVHLSDGTKDAEANATTISGTDVYVAGTDYAGMYNTNDMAYNGIAKYWKNGNPVSLTDGSVDAATTSISISGRNIYVAGILYDGILTPDNSGYYPNGIAVYWKNGNLVKLTDGSTDAATSSIAVSGDDVYVAGSGISDANGNSIATYWKNGSLVKLTDGSSNAVAASIAVAGSDVYVAGTVNGFATYWKNGIAVTLSNVSSSANSIYITKQ